MAELGEGDGARRQLRGRAAIAHALAAGEPLRIVLHARDAAATGDDALRAALEEAGIAVRAVARRELARLIARAAADADDDGWIALAGADPHADLASSLRRAGAVWLLVGTAYPGNAGFVIRTAEVSGAAAVAIDAAFDRDARRDALRAAMRADRYLPVHFAAAADVVSAARAAGRRVIAIEDVGAHAPWELDLRGPVLFVLGGEATGVPDALLDAVDAVVRIPMHGFIPSYNLQAAMAAVLAERLRQEAGVDTRR